VTLISIETTRRKIAATFPAFSTDKLSKITIPTARRESKNPRLNKISNEVCFEKTREITKPVKLKKPMSEKNRVAKKKISIRTLEEYGSAPNIIPKKEVDEQRVKINSSTEFI
jgi:hypothetical protein